MSERALAPVRFVGEPKPTGGVRWVARLDAATAATYAAAVIPFVPAIERALPPRVVANRVIGASMVPPRIRLEPWRTARARFRRAVRALALDAGAALMADVRDCYGSIGPEAVGDALQAVGIGPGALEPVTDVLAELSGRGVRGLPVGPEPSAVLANAVLLGADRRLAREGFRHVRWVDDLVVFTPDVSAAHRALEELGETLAELGLALAPDKTRVVIDPAVIRGGGPVERSGPPPQGRRASG